MCGIVGYVGERGAAPIILEGLRRLEYRGYDSAGLAVLAENGHVEIRRQVGRLEHLARLVAERPPMGRVGIGHTRWATHGPVTPGNAHPHCDPRRRVVVVHNGIVENDQSLRRWLTGEGHSFASDTDSEVLAHLIALELEAVGDLREAVRRAMARVEGAGSLVVMSPLWPDRLVAARLGYAGGVIIGAGRGEHFIASDAVALLPYTRDLLFLESHEMAVVTRDRVEVFGLDRGDARPVRFIHANGSDAEVTPGDHECFMEKEIFEQPEAVTRTLAGRLDFQTGEVRWEHLAVDPERARAIRQIHIVACGTSYYAGLVGKFLIERIARIPVAVDYGSEFRYRDPLISCEDVVLAISQSGETADTLASVSGAREQGATIWAIVNVEGSQLDRMADGAIHMRVGPEIGVASTKAFTASVVDLYLLALYLAQRAGRMGREEALAHVAELSRLPRWLSATLETCAPQARRVGEMIKDARSVLYLGRGIQYPIALEGALKLKEISYIHAEGYPAGEMKHGPIALMDERMPVVLVMPRDRLYEKMWSQLEQVRARGAQAIVIGTDDDDAVDARAVASLKVPSGADWTLPVLTVIPCQLVAYYAARALGRDVDHPRNLAKSVTVE